MILFVPLVSGLSAKYRQVVPPVDCLLSSVMRIRFHQLIRQCPDEMELSIWLPS